MHVAAAQQECQIGTRARSYCPDYLARNLFSVKPSLPTLPSKELLSRFQGAVDCPAMASVRQSFLRSLGYHPD